MEGEERGCLKCTSSMFSINSSLLKCPNGVFDLADKPHRSDPGRQQKEDLYKETSLHVCLRSAYHCLPPHIAAAGHHCGSLPHGATWGKLCVSKCVSLCLPFIISCRVACWQIDLTAERNQSNNIMWFVIIRNVFITSPMFLGSYSCGLRSRLVGMILLGFLPSVFCI